MHRPAIAAAGVDSIVVDIVAEAVDSELRHPVLPHT